ncbi:MAG: tRNA (guanosine(46)-N7)-methyltransferase TrmB [Acidobacteria bacterium]|jgi:tRNA (guanine-N7-)-methyltransferase|nr:tRNA (guanosine(46)-N7)-methyltransferase TrmB [Acidobacteriota bacterium]
MIDENMGGDVLSYEQWSPGHYLIRLRNKEEVEFNSVNKYVMLAQQLSGLLYTRPELQESFPRIFQNPLLPVVMEIGCYMGHTVIELAKRNPDLNILGVDIKYKRVVKSCYKIKRAGLHNAVIAIGDARELLHILPDNSIYGILAFFPDPWRKLKHEKHRFLDDYFFQTVSQKLKEKGFIWIKTDSKEYVDEVIEKVKKYNFTITNELSLGRNEPLIPGNHTTFFEQLFTKMGQPIYQIFLQKNN